MHMALYEATSTVHMAGLLPDEELQRLGDAAAFREPGYT